MDLVFASIQPTFASVGAFNQFTFKLIIYMHEIIVIYFIVLFFFFQIYSLPSIFCLENIL